MLTDETLYDIVKAPLQEGFPSGNYTVEHFGGESTVEEGLLVAKAARESGCDTIIGVGGGKVIDTAKFAANQAGLPVVIVPTAAASDAPCTALSVIYDEQGAFVESRRMHHNPDVVLVDTEILAAAPVRHLLSGMGDAFATYYEARACERSGADNFAGGQRCAAALALAELCRDLLLQYGAAARESVEKKQWSEALEKVVEANIFLSGIGAENTGAGIAHAIYSGMTQVWQPFPVMHGEAVAYGLLVQLAAEYDEAGGVDRREWETVQQFYRSVGLPLRLEQLNLAVDDTALHKLAEATSKLPNAKKMPFTVTPELLYRALVQVQTDTVG